MFAFLWHTASLGSLIIWYQVISSGVLCSFFSVFGTKLFCVREFGKSSILRVSWSLFACSRWSLNYHSMSISLHFFTFMSLVPGHLKVSYYLSFSSFLHPGQSGSKPSQSVVLSQAFLFLSYYRIISGLLCISTLGSLVQGQRPERREV